MYFDCGNDTNAGNWFKALVKASKIHEEQAKRISLHAEYRKRLNFEPDEVLTPKAITKAYRKVSLKVFENLNFAQISALILGSSRQRW